MISEFLHAVMPFISAILTGVIVSIFGVWINRRMKESDSKRDEARKEADYRMEEQCQKDLVLISMSRASAKLAYACAMALKRGKANGEVEEGVQAFREADKEYIQFMNEQAVKHLNEE